MDLSRRRTESSLSEPRKNDEYRFTSHFRCSDGIGSSAEDSRVGDAPKNRVMLREGVRMINSLKAHLLVWTIVVIVYIFFHKFNKVVNTCLYTPWSINEINVIILKKNE